MSYDERLLDLERRMAILEYRLGRHEDILRDVSKFSDEAELIIAGLEKMESPTYGAGGADGHLEKRAADSNSSDSEVFGEYRS